LVLFELRAGDELHLELIERFARMDYRCYRLVPGLDALVPFKATEGVDGYLLNLFAVPADRVVSLIEAQIVIDLAQTSPPDLQDEERKAVASAQGQLALGRSLAQAWANTAAEPAATPAWEWLAGWAVAHDNSRSLGSRYGALHAAYNSLKAKCGPEAPASRWSTLARLALELGERQQAVAADQQLLEALSGPAAEATPDQALLEEPFLPPHPALDDLDPAGREREWLLAAALTTVELASTHSGFFSGRAALPRLEKIRELGFEIPEMGRRLELLSQRFGLAAAAKGLDLPPPASPSAKASGASAPAGDRLQASAGWGGGYYTGLTYGCYSFGELAPNWLDFALLSQRQRPPRSAGEGSPFRYLELGSGMGLGLCLLAAAYPEGTFIGIDFHPSHIAHSQWLATELGLGNVSFHEADFLELAAADTRMPFDPGPGFHYAVAHGILSWIGPEVRAALLELAGRLLQPGGAFYCSYNTFPGWLDRSAFKALADLERQRQGSANLLHVFDKTHQTLERLLQTSVPLAQSFPKLSSNLKTIRSINQSDYLFGEYGAEYWQPFYVGQMHQLAAAHKLSYTASASLPDNFPSLLPAPLAEQLASEPDPTIRQALQDLAINQSFRRDLFIKGPLRLSRAAQEQQLSQLLLRNTFVQSADAAASSTLTTCHTSLGTITLDSARVQQVQVLLSQQPTSLAEIHQSLEITPDELVRFTSLLLHAGLVALDRGPAIDAAISSCREVNRRLMELMQEGNNLGFLAAPNVGHGAQPFSLIDVFVLDGLQQDLADDILCSCVLIGLQATGVELRGPDGALLTDADECLSKIQTHISQFRSTTFPRLVQLGIAGPVAAL
jgi:SAM-dependent methyltransferase